MEEVLSNANIVLLLKLSPNNFSIHQWILPTIIYCGILVMIFYFPHYFLIYQLGFFSKEELSSLFIYLLKYLFLSVWPHGCLFYSMVYSPILLFSFVNCSSFDFWKSFQFGCSTVSTSPYLFQSIALHAATARGESLSCTFSVPALQTTISLEEPWFLLLDNDIIDQDLCGIYAHCYWGVTNFSPSQWTELQNICMYVY